MNVDPGQVTDCPFTPVAGTKISVYDCNPVFEIMMKISVGTWAPLAFMREYGASILPNVMHNGGSYGDFAMNYAVSPDGTEWDTHPNNPLFKSYPGAWDRILLLDRSWSGTPKNLNT